jgi:hypothetical protein
MKYLIYVSLFFSMFIFAADEYSRVSFCNNADCTIGCEQSLLVKKIEINIEKNLITVTPYLGVISSKPFKEPYHLDNCAIIDKKNWECNTANKDFIYSSVNKNGKLSQGPIRLKGFLDSYGCSYIKEE